MKTISTKKHSTAVLLVDMQTRFVAGLTPENRSKLCTGQATVLKQCAEFDIPVAAMEYYGHGETIPELRKLMHHVPRVRRFRKFEDDCFSVSELDPTLREWGSGSLIFMGMHATLCILDSAESAHRRGFKIYSSDHLIENGKYIGNFAMSRRLFEEKGVFVEGPSFADNVLAYTEPRQ